MELLKTLHVVELILPAIALLMYFMHEIVQSIKSVLNVIRGVDGKVNELNNRVNEMNGRVDSQANSIGNLEAHFSALQEALNQSQAPAPEKVEEVVDLSEITQMISEMGY